MGITGKYDFQGIKEKGAKAIKALIALSPWGRALLASPIFKFFEPAEEAAIEALVNYAANEGLVLLNIGAIVVNGVVDQNRFNQAMHDGLDLIEQGRDKITPAQGKAMDDEVIAAMRKFIPLGATPKP